MFRYHLQIQNIKMKSHPDKAFSFCSIILSQETPVVNPLKFSFALENKLKAHVISKR